MSAPTAARLIDANLGVAVADAEQVALRYERGALILEFIDYRDRPQRVTFDDVLAFRWQELDDSSVRDDLTYEVVGSEWLARQAYLSSVAAGDYAHYMLCFNTGGVLDLLCRRRKPPAEEAGA